MYTCKKRFCYSFSLLKYRYEISIVDISTLLKNIDIDRAILKNIDIDKANPKISISISILIRWFWKISISIRQFCKISISIKYRIDSNLAYRTGLGFAAKLGTFHACAWVGAHKVEEGDALRTSELHSVFLLRSCRSQYCVGCGLVEVWEKFGKVWDFFNQLSSAFLGSLFAIFRGNGENTRGRWWRVWWQTRQ